MKLCELGKQILERENSWQQAKPHCDLLQVQRENLLQLWVLSREDLNHFNVSIPSIPTTEVILMELLLWTREKSI